ncbi:hypothetical protein AtNW77_Chr5g0124741 [Arabidopsis thaliana]|uniref:Uncharacterized protein n=4 Tax=Arabidopsis TaxID=3701 RepID=A0A178UNX3_ARATH|nr:uncharacterized protein AT5G42110 [Arabidopsis thaliana]KAG7604597.1 hypothetical protein ISN45_At05g036690 [Arabidopsis thaliana x Arabidopsis arenosa]KAG7611527.1 hypothetical protein ISN44_As05g036220 [Arabidopsis suecica]AED94769.1 hypothetical protein AT5G42110 [Arabidopsis thaliana]OAO95539.1 hypothetical protein AXX17_AT5G39920 [Arabidopsis thaliana]CAA0406920.1 unnamed protein product [Arabidopsis thaliana]|eukprot:NP_199026.4 hypothetical protein AT5G42110 [Arabidopsis thaliana]
MKVSSGVVASVIAVSTAALSSSSILPPVSPKVWESRKTNGSDNFEPRFDGLRFIETLVTAHR